MEGSIKPDWMAGFAPDPKKGNPVWSKGGPSPNPRGRPVGLPDRRTKVTQALMEDAPAVARVVIQAALEGDMQAAGLVLARCAPAIKPQAERVEFELSPDSSPARQAQQVLEAVACGQIDPDTAKSLLGCIQVVADIRAVEALEGRVQALEDQQL